MGSPTVAYKQAHTPSPRVKASLQGLTSSVRYLTAWADAFTFVNDALGFRDGSPWIWPASPNMRATEASIEPVGNKIGGAASDASVPGNYYLKAYIDVQFSSAVSILPMPSVYPVATQFDPANPVDMSSFSVQYSAEMIKLPSSALQWSFYNADGTAQTIPASIKDPGSGNDYYRCPTFTLNLTLQNCLYVNYNNFANKIGLVNSSTMWGCGPETILLDGASTNRREMASGLPILDVTLSYKWRAVGWNVAMASNGNFMRYARRQTDSFGSVIIAPGNTVYQVANINPTIIIPTSQRWTPGV